MVVVDGLTVKLQSLNEKVKFSATARENQEVIIDYFPPVGDAQGYTSLELLMASFGYCVSTTILTLLRHRMNKQVDGIAVEVKGQLREEHPKALESMLVTLRIRAKDLSQQEVRQTLAASEEKLCPVWAMLNGNVAIDFEIFITE